MSNILTQKRIYLCCKLNPEMKKDILTRYDIKLLVDTFYNKVKQNELLNKIFSDVMKVNWEHHLPKMYDFWEMILFHTGGYKGQPFPPHLIVNEKEPLTDTHFNQWLLLFHATIDELFEGENASTLKTKSLNIKGIWSLKIGHINKH